MKPPTDKEILTAHLAIHREGPMAEAMIAMALLVVKDATLASILARMVAQSVATPEAMNPTKEKALAAGALVSGLNLGIRIGEARGAELLTAVVDELTAGLLDEPLYERVEKFIRDQAGGHKTQRGGSMDS